MTDSDRTSAEEPAGGDALGRLIRAAGRRPAPSADEYERVRLAAHLAWQMKVHSGRRRRLAWWALAAGVAAAALIVAATQPWQPSSSAVAQLTLARGTVERLTADGARWEALPGGAPIGAGARLRTSTDGGAALALAGGIVVRAHAATEWAFDGPARLTLGEGTLYVDTGASADTVRELEIVTPHGVVAHVGTQYEVRARSAELRIRVREGRVRVLSGAAGLAHEAPAGEELSIGSDGAVARRPVAADSPEWQWAQALAAPIELDGGSAFDALQWVARETGKRLIFEDANAELLARSAIIHGNSRGLEPLQVLEIVMATSAGLDYALGDGTLVVRRR